MLRGRSTEKDGSCGTVLKERAVSQPQEWVHYDEMVVDVTSAFLEAPPPTHSYFLSLFYVFCFLISFFPFPSYPFFPHLSLYPLSLTCSPSPFPSPCLSHIYTLFSSTVFSHKCVIVKHSYYENTYM